MDNVVLSGINRFLQETQLSQRKPFRMLLLGRL